MSREQGASGCGSGSRQASGGASRCGEQTQRGKRRGEWMWRGKQEQRGGIFSIFFSVVLVCTGNISTKGLQ